MTQLGKEMRDKTAISGVGLMIGNFPERTPLSLAVEAYQRETGPFALIVLDLMMPVMTGRQAFEAIREFDPHVPVLFASGYQATDRLPDPLPPGTAFLSKPYTPSQLAAAIRRLIDSQPHHVGEGI